MKTSDIVFKLRTKDKLTYKEIADKLNISKATVSYHSKKMGVNGKFKMSELTRKQKEYEKVKNYRQRQKIKAVQYLGSKCKKCGYNKCVQALEFHHRNPKEKEFSFSKYSNHSWMKIKKELDKCDLLCANCHREEHYSNK